MGIIRNDRDKLLQATPITGRVDHDVVLSLSSVYAVLSANSSGVVSTPANANTTATVVVDGIVDTSNWDISAVGVGCSVTYASNNVFFTDFSGTNTTDLCSYIVTATKEGYVTQTATVQVVRVRSASGGGGAADISTLLLYPPSLPLLIDHASGTAYTNSTSVAKVMRDGVDVTSEYIITANSPQVTTSVTGNVVTVNGVPVVDGFYSQTFYQFSLSNGEIRDDSRWLRNVAAEKIGGAEFVSTGGPTGAGGFLRITSTQYDGLRFTSSNLSDFTGQGWKFSCWIRVHSYDFESGFLSAPIFSIGAISLGLLKQDASNYQLQLAWQNDVGTHGAILDISSSSIVGAGWVHVSGGLDASKFMRLWLNGTGSSSTYPTVGVATQGRGAAYAGSAGSFGLASGTESFEDFLEFDIADVRLLWIDAASTANPSTRLIPAVHNSAEVTVTATGPDTLSAVLSINGEISSPSSLSLTVSQNRSTVLLNDDGSIASGASYDADVKVGDTSVLSTTYVATKSGAGFFAKDKEYNASWTSRSYGSGTEGTQPIRTTVAQRRGYLPVFKEHFVQYVRSPLATPIATGVQAVSVQATASGVATGVSVPVAVVAWAGTTNVTGLYTWAATITPAGAVTLSSSSSASPSITAMNTTQPSAVISLVGTRSGYPQLRHDVTVTKITAAAPIISVPPSVVVAGDYDGNVPAISLPVTLTTTASASGTDVTGLYTWTASPSAGITLSSTSIANPNITAMSIGTDSGTITWTGTRTNWPNLTGRTSVSKTRLLLPASTIVTSLPAITIFDNASAATVGLKLTTDGRIQVYRQNATGTWVTVANYYNPTTTSIGSSYRVRLLGTTYGSVSGTWNSWIPLTSDVVWRAGSEVGGGVGSHGWNLSQIHIASNTGTDILGAYLVTGMAIVESA